MQQMRPAPQSLADMHWNIDDAAQSAWVETQRGPLRSGQHHGASPSQRAVPQRTCDPRGFASRGRVLIQGPGSAVGAGSTVGAGAATGAGSTVGAAVGQRATEDAAGGAAGRGDGATGSAVSRDDTQSLALPLFNDVYPQKL